MSKLVVQLFQYSGYMTVVVVLYIILFGVLKERYSAKTFYYAGWMIMFGFLFPFRPYSFTSRLRIITGNKSSSNIRTVQVPAVDSRYLEKYGIDMEMRLTIIHVIGSIWLLGVAVTMLYFVLRYVRFRKMTERWSTECTELMIVETLNGIKKRYGIMRQIGIKTCTCVSSPMLVGVCKPIILLPEIQLSLEELEIIFLHEIEHFKRNDIICKIFLNIAVVLNWFNPFIYVFSRIFTYLCELSCDEEVSDNMDYEERLLYVSIILKIAKEQIKCNTAFSMMFFGGEKNMKHRIYSIMNNSKKKICSSLLVMCLMLIVSTQGISAAPQEFSYGIITAEAIAEEMEEAFSETFSQEFNEADFPGMIITYDENGIPIVTDPSIYVERAVYATTIYPKNGFYTSSDCSDDSLLFYILQGQSVKVLDSSSYTDVAKVNYAGRDGYMKKYQLDF